MGYNKSIDIGLGQLGSGFNNDTFTNTGNPNGSGVNTVAIQPPPGKVIASILFLEGTTIRELVPETSTDATFKGPRVLATGVSELNYAAVATPTAANGGGSQSFSNTATLFPKGMTIFGRYTKVMIEKQKSQSFGNQAGVTYGVVTTYSY